MDQETPESLNKCPGCSGEMKFIWISLQDQTKMCINTKCSYPFVRGVTPELRGVKLEIEKEDHDISEVEKYVKSVKSEEERDKLFNEDLKAKFLSDINGFATAVHEVHCRVTNERLSGIEELCDLFVELPKTSNIDAGKTEVNRNASHEESLDSMSELEKMLCVEENQTDMQWNADDFEVETLEINNVDKNETIPHSKDNDLNVNVIAKQDGGAVTKASEDMPLAVCCTSVTAKESKVQNDLSINNCTLEVETENIPFLSTNQTVSASTATSSNEIIIRNQEDCDKFINVNAVGKKIKFILNENKDVPHQLKFLYSSTPKKQEREKDSHDSEIMHISKEVSSVASTEYQSGIETAAVLEQSSVKLKEPRCERKKKQKPCCKRRTTRAAVKRQGNNPKNTNVTALSHTARGGLETAVVEQASAEINNVSDKSNKLVTRHRRMKPNRKEFETTPGIDLTLLLGKNPETNGTALRRPRCGLKPAAVVQPAFVQASEFTNSFTTSKRKPGCLEIAEQLQGLVINPKTNGTTFSHTARGGLGTAAVAEPASVQIKDASEKANESLSSCTSERRSRNFCNNRSNRQQPKKN